MKLHKKCQTFLKKEIKYLTNEIRTNKKKQPAPVKSKG